MSDSAFRVKHTHSFPAGHSGPARSYWDVYVNRGPALGTLCLHHEDSELDPILQADGVVRMLQQAFDMGRQFKAEEVRRVLGVADR